MNLIIFLVGLLILVQLMLKSWLKVHGIPGIISFIMLGFLLSAADHQWHFFTAAGRDILEFLANIGLITLLFRIGLESDISQLWCQLKRASLILVGDVGISALSGFMVSRFLLGMPVIPSMFVGLALSATSVGVSISIWERAGKLKTESGELLLDVAELDDISGIILMALLFTLIPVIREKGGESIFMTVLRSGGWILIKLLGFGLICAIFSRFLEESVTDFFQKIDVNPNTSMLLLGGFGFIIASLAVVFGFSLAIGAFFAGLAFSRDSDAVKLDTAFNGLDSLFSPFFFIGIGLRVDPAVLTQAIFPAVILILTAFISKILADGSGSLLFFPLKKSALIGLSMVPRAEITMIIMQHGHRLGAWAVPAELFAAVVSVVLLTCLITPLIIQKLLNRITLTSVQSEAKG